MLLNLWMVSGNLIERVFKGRCLNQRMSKIKIGVIASGSGSNFQAIGEACQKGILKDLAEVVLLICNKPGKQCLTRAENLGIPTKIIPSDGFTGTREEYDELLIKALKEVDVDLVCLAGYMRLLSGHFIQAFQDKVMNIHPALLPSFKGLHAHRDVLEYGAKVSGCTVHFVDEKVDHGAIIGQRCVKVHENDTEETLGKRVLTQEHQLYPHCIKLFAEGRLEIEGRVVRVLDPN